VFELVCAGISRSCLDSPCHGSSTANQAAKDVLLDTAINQGNVEIAERGSDVEGCLGADSSHLRID
jgi:hypothetical protein